MIGTLAMIILAPIAAMLVQMAISRTREYAADELAPASSVARMRWPRRCSRSRRGPAIQIPAAERNPATAHLFIVNPLTGRGMDNLFSTHPSTENRIAALERLAAEMGRGGFDRRASTPVYRARSGSPGGNGLTRGPWG